MESTELAKQYFELSNQGDLESIRSLFHEHATYSSANVGLYFGRENILSMMEKFFSSYTHRQWTIEQMEEVKPNIVQIWFSFKGTLASGELQQRRGVESIISHDAKIRHIEVRPIDG